MRVLLAPMGVLDSLLRELLTELTIDLCITEFLRVVDQLLPVKSFYRLCRNCITKEPHAVRNPRTRPAAGTISRSGWRKMPPALVALGS